MAGGFMEAGAGNEEKLQKDAGKKLANAEVTVNPVPAVCIQW